MNFKTIILLSNKRSGSTFMQNIFRNNQDVKLFHQNQKEKVVECQYWSLSAELLKKKISYKYFIDKIYKETKININSFSNENLSNENDIFNLWEKILSYHDSNIFDKSPQYLSSIDCLRLINNYSNYSKRVKLLFLIRDPRDIISSQYKLWKGNIKTREFNLINKLDNYHYLKKLNKDIYTIKYENFENDLINEIIKIFTFCNINYINDELKSIFFKKSIKYQNSLNKKINKWVIEEKLKNHLEYFNYDIELKKFNFLRKIISKLNNIIK